MQIVADKQRIALHRGIAELRGSRRIAATRAGTRNTTTNTG
jgi:hypothetical protein